MLSFKLQVNSPLLLHLHSRNAQIPSALLSNKKLRKKGSNIAALQWSVYFSCLLPVNNSIEQNFREGILLDAWCYCSQKA